MATSSASLRVRQTQGGSNSSSEFIEFTATMRLPIPPVFSASSNTNMSHSQLGDAGMDGVREVLAGWVMRYLPPLHAVVLSFDPNPKFLHPSALFSTEASPFDHDDSLAYLKSNALASPPPASNSTTTPTTIVKDELEQSGQLVRLKTLPMIDGSGFTLADVEWRGLGWKPRVGMKVVGTPTLSTSSHISLLLHNLFNASIPSSHIPRDQYEFDPECPVPAVVLERRQQQQLHPKATAAVDLEAVAKKQQREALGIEGDDADDSDSDDEQDERDDKEEEEEEGQYSEQGWWVDKQTREPLGGASGRIEFTIAALSTHNSLLSCTGSLLQDPFTKEAIDALQDPLSSNGSIAGNGVSSSIALLQAQQVRTGHSLRKSAGSDDEEEGASSDSSDSDGESQVSGDDDDAVGTGIPVHEGVPSNVQDPTRSDDEDSDSSRSPSPEPKSKKSKVTKEQKKGGKTVAEKQGNPPQVSTETVVEGQVKKKRKGEEVDKGKKSKKAKKE
ncbi:uncharacterized protein JCM15063_000125 [Sporobolomyces koalae]|uniref:uncharacterized protein n=1 Tax=Sporobolomyces koalae TaxID=500713 RepID=UPI00317F3C58